ncbi:MAG: hypothetical protein IPN34_11070 [Planctomycetes bacterium]|nr:hypothetical protein [Planctomycetota bacterium]
MIAGVRGDRALVEEARGGAHGLEPFALEAHGAHEKLELLRDHRAGHVVRAEEALHEGDTRSSRVGGSAARTSSGTRSPSRRSRS